MPRNTRSSRSTRRAARACSPPTSPDRRPRGALAASFAAALLATACSPQLSSHDGADLIAPAVLLGGAVLAGPAPAMPDANPLGTDEAMRAFIARHVNRLASERMRLRQLIDALIGQNRFAMAYGERTFTAAEAFHRREANCLSFTGMFVALAREAGLEVSFQEVEIPPDWSRSGDSFVLNRHVDAVVRDGSGRDRVVDFNIADFRSSYDRRLITDRRALAHYYSNLGVEHLQAGELVEGLRRFRKAIEHDPGFAPAWVNLGSLYLRAGHAQWAISAWRHALSLSPGETVALSNLERVYRSQGRIALADELHERLRRHRMGNPYYRYHLAQEAFARADYATAIAHLRYAAREKPGEERFAALLGLSYLRFGNDSAARRWLARAAAVAGEDGARSGNSSKIARLGLAGTG